MKRLRDNIAGWRNGTEKLDVQALYSELSDLYGPNGLTSYCALLLADLWAAEEAASSLPSGGDG